MHIERLDLADPGDRVAGLYAVHEALGDPGAPMSPRHFASKLRGGWSGERAETWVVGVGGEIAGGCTLYYPDADNTHMANLPLFAVHPDRRRQGLGGALLDLAIDRARGEGRRLLLGEAPTGGPGAGFAEARGFTRATDEARRVLDLRTVDWASYELMRADAARHARGYSLERWIGPAGEELLDDMALLMTSMNDEPLGDLDMEDHRWTAERFRVLDHEHARSGLTSYTVIARHAESGEPAGFTRLLVDADDARGWARQVETGVIHAHRGHRLGTVLKLANAIWFHTCEPAVERIITWNADDNAYMLAINESMGFRILDTWNGWQLRI
ncbi:GNAT family N-acetyltransferase [Microtetraspora sp. NBRC 16547]|uniref:GNAT family N-acetyltransferase n=1 Tax=Microtetraspora sp. NBRC 16547 TaxID=3030993 RepID=UPI0024A3327E|nr:GNAT family N-acetyltransferase [Microtetraspora sp. NBRC 16547]GLW97878.1 GNAT family N-acetyltransferase [Microtetraspora sp. NBRC 16547]